MLRDYASPTASYLTLPALSAELVQLHQQTTFGGVVASTAKLLGLCTGAVLLGAVRRDVALDRWQLSVLLHTNGEIALEEHQAAESFDFWWAEAPQRVSLADVLEELWSPVNRPAAAELLAGCCAFAVPITDAGEPLAALLAFAPEESEDALALSILSHAALASRHYFSRYSEALARLLLTPAQLQNQADTELDRARRYGRDLAVILLQPERPSRLQPLGEQLAAHIRRWDLVGVETSPAEQLVTVLPETGRTGVLGFLRRLAREGIGTAAGAALLHTDGGTLEQLLTVARERLCPLTAPRSTGGAPNTERVWLHAAPLGPGPETVACPGCLTLYSPEEESVRPDVGDEEREALRATCRGSCPDHTERVTMPADHRQVVSGETQAVSISLLERLRRQRTATSALPRDAVQS